MGGLKLTHAEWKSRVEGAKARGLPEAKPIVWQGTLPPLCIVATGPSMKDHLGALKRMVKQGARLMVVNRAYGAVVRAGLTPDLFAAFDPDESMVGAVAPACDHTFHLLASQMHPKVFDALQGKKVAVWHAWSRGFDWSKDGSRKLDHAGEVYDLWGVEHTLHGGSHIGLQAMTLATFLGHFDLHLFGFDGCIRKGRKHAVNQAREEAPEFDIEYEGRSYTMDPALSLQAHEFEIMARNFGHKFNLTFHGHGILAAIWKKETHGRLEERFDLPRVHEVVQRRVQVEGRAQLV